MTHKRLVHVYIAGPISRDPIGGTRSAILEKAALEATGHIACYAPQLSTLEQLMFPREYEEWMRLDFSWIEKCDALFRIAGESDGADREVAFALELGLPVFYRRDDLIEWACLERGSANG